MSTMHTHIRSLSRHQQPCYRQAATLLALALLGLNTACSTLPAAGPRASAIHDEASDSKSVQPFVLVDVSGATIMALAQRKDSSLASQFGDKPTNKPLLIGPGDGLSVSIWEAGSEPLFTSSSPTLLGTSSSSSRAANLGEQIVGSDGCISLPFVGRVKVAGLSSVEAQTAIEQALNGKAQKPQVLISVSRNLNSAVTVIGEAAGGTRIPLSPYGEHLLDALASAGGARAPTYETQIQLTRDGSSVSVALQAVLDDPHENVLLQPGDLLVITRQPQTYTAFGATGRNALINFEARQLNLIEAVAKAGGLQDQRADARGVFLFRYEPQALAQQLGKLPESLQQTALVPVVYQLDLTKAGTYFLGQSFELRDRDMLYVANSPSTELEKFLQLVGLISQPIVTGAVVKSTTN